MAGSGFELSPTFDRDVRAGNELASVLEHQVAGPIVERARAAAPVGDPAVDSTAGGYRDSIHTVVTTGHNGEKHVHVVADDPKAAWVEYGDENIPAHATLRRAAHG